MPRVLRTIGAFLSLAVLVPLTPAQQFTNTETPQVKPITTVRLADIEVVVACNTPDSSIELYGASAPHAFIARIKVGLGPVTVRWNPDNQLLYSCNFDGDSVSVIDLGVAGSDYQVLRTVDVGDEPADIYFTTSDDGDVAHVTLNSQSAVSDRDPITLAPLGDRFLLTPSASGGQNPEAVKQPRVARVLSDGRVFIANFMGDEPISATTRQYDLDMYVEDPSLALPLQINGMGTTHHSFTVDEAAQRMFVVGTRARHQERAGVHEVAKLPTGFVQSWLWVVDIPSGTGPTVRSEAPAGPTAPIWHSIDLNRNYNGVPPMGQNRAAVLPANAIAQPTDIVRFVVEATEEVERPVQKLFVSMFHSDTVAVLEPNSGLPGGWRINRIPLPLALGGSGYSMVGPRGLAISTTAVNPDAEGRGLLYCLNRFENTISVIDPVGEFEITRIALQNDPTPAQIRTGREFIFSAEFSGNGAVSCASCHVDGRTDGLAWNLGEDSAGPVVNPWLNDGNAPIDFTLFPPDKGPMVTQTLQGLVNSQVNLDMQVLFTNAPYHWRGDKRTVNEFNEAFVNLQGMTSISGFPSGPDAQGITPAQMAQAVAFVNTIVHPPNPEQALDRRQTGTLDTTSSATANDPTNAGNTDDLLGLMLFHNNPAVGVRSCVHCHNLPDGSSNTMTLNFNVPDTLGTSGPDRSHPFESAAMRNVFQRERFLQINGNIPAFPNIAETANFGLLHPGDPNFLTSSSINSFVGLTFFSMMPGPNVLQQIESLVTLSRHFDTGMAPASGHVHTMDGSATDAQEFDLLEDQAREANIGFAVSLIQTPGSSTGYWFDVTQLDPMTGRLGMYRLEGTSTLVDRFFFVAQQSAGATVILQGTPIGNERRIASATGTATMLTGPAPTSVVLQPMRPATHWEQVTNFNLNLPFPGGAMVSPAAPARMFSLESRHLFWTAVTSGGTVARFGVPTGLRHEPPRRFAVSGSNIRPGALLALEMSVGAPQTSGNPPRFLVMDLHPTEVGQSVVWETTVEADPMITLGLLNGGLFAPDVVSVAQGAYHVNTNPPPPTSLDPVGWNFYRAIVVNEDGTLSAPSAWTPLTVQ